jgi:hypothetical protein
MRKIMRLLFIISITFIIKINLFSGEIYKNGFVYETYVDPDLSTGQKNFEVK